MTLTSCWRCSLLYSMGAEHCPACSAANANVDFAKASAEFDRQIARTPEIPPPVWDARPIDSSKAMAAVRAMCGGSA